MAKADTKATEEKPNKRTSKKSTEGAATGNSSAPEQAASTESTAPQAPESAAATATAGALDSALLPATSGKIGVFGGPKDRGIKPDDKLALPTGKHFSFERVRSLNPKSFYAAMRWDYHVLGKSNEEGKRWWANKKISVTNAAKGITVVVRAVDFGPPESTGLSIAVSPGAAEALGIEVGDEVEIAFADPRLPTGVVEEE